jgi:acetolactate synthase I/II/III large subunit
VLLVLGARLGEMTTSGYSLISAPVPVQTLIHVHADANELNRVYQAALPVCAGMPQIAAALASLLMPHSEKAPSPLAPLPEGEGDSHRLPARNHVAQARLEYQTWQAEPPASAQSQLNLWQVMETLAQQMPASTLIANGAGNFASWAHRFWRYGGIEQYGRTQLAPTSGTMGYGMPAGIAAAIVQPEKPVLIFAGDGDFLMTGQELATAVQYGVCPIIIIFNNRQYGTIRMHQAKAFPGRISGTLLRNPDFAALARAYGAWGEQARSVAEFQTALTQAVTFTQTRQGPALIELMTDPRLITPSQLLADS